jgi:hypothetical protein|nr:MAG TPA: hypothetical protein [Caudoviricetes sp.]
MARKESIMETTQLVNLTPHTITLVDQNNQPVLTVDSSAVARVSAQTTTVGTYSVNGIEIPRTHTVYGEVEGLPAPTPGTVYIVSGMIVSALASQGIRRDDVVVPGMQVRDDQGRVIGCRSLDN